MRKWALTMARNSVGTVRSGNERCRHHRRHRQNDGIARPQRHRDVAEIERRSRAPPSKANARKRWPKTTLPPFASTNRSAGSTKAADSPSRATSGRQAAPARGQRLADHRARRGWPSLAGGSVLSAASSKRPEQPVIERALAIEHLADGRAGRRAQQAQHGQIIARARARHAAVGGRRSTTGCGRHWRAASSAHGWRDR